MSHSGWGTRVVAENVGGPNWEEEAFTRTEERNDALQKLDKLEAEAAGMRAALELDVQIEEFDCPHNHEQSCRCGELEGELWKKYHNARDKALSGEAGKEILREMDHLKDTIDLKDTALKSALGGLKASKIEIELIEHERDEARADLDRLKGGLNQEKATTREWADMMRRANFRLQGEWGETCRERDDIHKQLETAQKELAELSNRDSEAKAECIRIVEESTKELETAQKETKRQKAHNKLLTDTNAELKKRLDEVQRGVGSIVELKSQLETAQKELEATREELDIAHRDLDHENISQLQCQLETVQRFKIYVHERLDKAGVPVDPDPEHNAKHGCRIQGRLNWVFAQLETAQKELAELNNRDSEAKAECIRTMEKSIRELETAQRQVDRLLWASRRVRDGYPQEARGTYYEDLCTVIRVVESGLAGRDYVHKDELEKVKKQIADVCNKVLDALEKCSCNKENLACATCNRLPDFRVLQDFGKDYVPRSEVSRAVEAERELARAIRARGKG